MGQFAEKFGEIALQKVENRVGETIDNQGDVNVGERLMMCLVRQS